MAASVLASEGTHPCPSRVLYFKNEKKKKRPCFFLLFCYTFSLSKRFKERPWALKRPGGRTLENGEGSTVSTLDQKMAVGVLASEGTHPRPSRVLYFKNEKKKKKTVLFSSFFVTLFLSNNNRRKEMTLRERTKILVAKEKHYTAKIIKHLAIINREKRYCDYGYPTSLSTLSMN